MQSSNRRSQLLVVAFAGNSPPRLLQVQSLEPGSLNAVIDEFLDQAR